ncbi:hypothetical protein JI721_01565 [Alicyclobacillus cycloheptanicus]|uniref:Uncharacterized protein n=1 Tax=Alicyclobacillus cycloheptanicus TaxID=1457 RepID=A0ABT9XHM2_9BACL|nr:CBO0543 family protein [Alicyclobacillus cycloheptanicus]MDQ0189529.1 hypothetical protein [Alicyclobacillus cycloheptanicus]WDM01587.1 hypothetical protein JI721_01565 [Alicyclobacillus cycloheptanicus]
MTRDQQQVLNSVVNAQHNAQQAWMNYWLHYSSAATWQFWLCLAIFVAPLVVLYFTLDRKKAFRIGFLGLNIHVWFAYIDACGLAWGLWSYPYKVVPFRFPSVTLDASLVPVTYMLVYQWTLNQKRSYYLYATILSALFAFVLKPIMVWSHFFQMYQWMNYFYLFCGYLIVMLAAKFITDFFTYLQKSQGNQDVPRGEDLERTTAAQPDRGPKNPSPS